jgi:HEAT repeat protein
MLLEDYLNELVNLERPLAASQLINLSRLAEEEVSILKSNWRRIDVVRRRDIVARLAELAEDNFELDFNAVFRLGLEDEDPKVRQGSIEGLWECEEASLIEPLSIMLCDDPVPEVRAAAANALGKFALLCELGKLYVSYCDRVDEALLSSIERTDEVLEVHRRSLEAISVRNLEAVNEQIIKAYYSGQPKLQISALYAMGRNCDPRWLSYILPELESDDAETRFEAATACGQIEDERAVPSLLPLLSDADDQVRFASIEALSSIGGDEAREALNELLEGADDEMAEVIQDALREANTKDDLLGFEP